jgi:hypothetical protein
MTINTGSFMAQGYQIDPARSRTKALAIDCCASDARPRQPLRYFLVLAIG